MPPSPLILWFDRALRLRDNPVLKAALAHKGPVVPLYIWDPGRDGAWAPGGRSRWWLARSLAALDADLRGRGSRLILRAGDSARVLRQVSRETSASSVVTEERFEPAARAQQRAVAEAVSRDKVAITFHLSSLLVQPSQIFSGSGGPYRVFTPFWGALRERVFAAPSASVPRRIPSPTRWPTSEPPAGLIKGVAAPASHPIGGAWRPGEAGARAALARFLQGALDDYNTGRDLPAFPGTSRLSPHLHFGEISPGRVFAEIGKMAGSGAGGARRFQAELGWREFAHHLLVHFPETPDQPLRPEFGRFPWKDDPLLLRSWQAGMTGYPLVDAGMRELEATGWMHNRVRMVAASFLVKHLLVSWQAGARWFWEKLVDADLANNTLGWQWSAGCGADAAPYFRIFHPVRQGERFDAEGGYVRHWVPELKRLPDAFIHRPWEAPAGVLEEAGVRLGGTYPSPVVDHAAARARALAAYRTMRVRG